MATSETATGSDKVCLRDIDVAILAGGLGTRLHGTLDDLPKVLAPIGGRPFLAILLDRLAAHGTRRVVMALGHLAGRVVEYLERRGPGGPVVEYEIETEPQGTAGAIRAIAHRLEHFPVMVMNGDSFVDADLCDFRDAHRQSGAGASILCTRVADAGRFGAISLDEHSRVVGFAEKGAASPGLALINAGVYLFEREMIGRIAGQTEPSLERDIFQNLPQGYLNGFGGDFRFIDIGTPESLAAAERFFEAPTGRDRQ